MQEMWPLEQASLSWTKIFGDILGAGHARHTLFSLELIHGVLSILYVFYLLKITCVLVLTNAVGWPSSQAALPKVKQVKTEMKGWLRNDCWWPIREMTCEIPWSKSLKDSWTICLYCFKHHGVGLGSAMSYSSYHFKFLCYKSCNLQVSLL